MLNYEQPVYRPPSEGRSLLIQVTIGCSHNLCTYCDMYRSKKYRVKSLDDIRQDFTQAKIAYQKQGFSPEKIFFCDGDALAAPTDFLFECLKLTFEFFPHVKRVGTYATGMNILEKSSKDLKRLNEAGLKIAYLGMESGCNKVLKKIVKGNTKEEMIEASLKIKQAGFKLSTIVMIGVGGEENSDSHITNTAEVLSIISPHYLSFLVTSPVVGTPFHRMLEKEIIHLPTEKRMLFEMKEILKSLSTKLPNEILFRANHVSNQVPLAGTLPQDIPQLTKTLDYWYKKMPDVIRKPRNGHM